MNQRVYQLFYRHFIGRCNHSKSEIILFTLLTKLENQTTQLCISYCKAHSKFLNFVFFIVNLRKMYDIKVRFIFEFPFCLDKYMTYIYVMSLTLKSVIYVGLIVNQRVESSKWCTCRLPSSKILFSAGKSYQQIYFFPSCFLNFVIFNFQNVG